MAVRTNFILKKPAKGRRSFSILKRTITDKKTTYEKVESEAINAINQSLRDGIQTQSYCEGLAKEVIVRLYAELNKTKPKSVHNSENRALLEKYWKAEYDHRDLVSVESAKNDLKRAIEAVGPLSLYSATREEVQKEISKHVKGNNQRRVVARLNQLFKFIGRNIKLRKDRKTIDQVAYISLPDFQKILTHIEDENLKLIHEVAFYTGARAGEIFALVPNSLKKNLVDIQNQIDRDMNRRAVKNGIARRSFVIPEGRARVDEWCKVKDKTEHRAVKLANVTKAACKKAFPNDKEKWLVFHDLRHSYAVHLLSKGVSISLVAQSLGNSVSVCQTHYAGFTLSSESVDAIEQIVGKKV